MNTDQKRYNVTLFNRSYSIVSDESENVITAVEKKVNDTMETIARTMSLTDEKQIAILAALQIASDLIKESTTIHSCNQMVEELSCIIDQEMQQ